MARKTSLPDTSNVQALRASAAQPGEIFRHVPYDIEVEQALLGAILVDNAAMDVAATILRSLQFYDPLHQRIFEYLQHARASGEPFDDLTVHAGIKNDSGLVEVGGHGYLAGLAKAAPALPSIRHLCRILADLATRRALIRAGEDIVNAAFEAPHERPIADQIKFAREVVGGIEALSPSADETPIHSSAEFVKGFAPPDYLLDGIIQRGFFYSNTAPTGVGKTAIMLRLMAHVGLGRAFCGHDVERGRVLMLVGENPDDVRARWIVLAEQIGFVAQDIDCHFMPGVFSIRDAMQRIKTRVAALGGDRGDYRWAGPQCPRYRADGNVGHKS